MIFGVLLSGFFMSRYRPSARAVAAYVAASKFIYAFGLLYIMLFNCGFENDLPGTLTADGRYTPASISFSPPLPLPPDCPLTPSVLKFVVKRHLQPGLPLHHGEILARLPTGGRWRQSDLLLRLPRRLQGGAEHREQHRLLGLPVRCRFQS